MLDGFESFNSGTGPWQRRACFLSREYLTQASRARLGVGWFYGKPCVPEHLVRDCYVLDHLGGDCVLRADNPFMGLACSHRALGWRVRLAGVIMGACGKATVSAAGRLAFLHNSLSRRTEGTEFAGDASRYLCDVVDCDAESCLYHVVVEVGHAAG